MNNELKNKLIQLKKDIKQINYTLEDLEVDDKELDSSFVKAAIDTADELEVLETILNEILK